MVRDLDIVMSRNVTFHAHIVEVVARADEYLAGI